MWRKRASPFWSTWGPFLPKVCGRFDISVGVSWAITKLPFNKGSSESHTVPHSSHLISLLYAKPAPSCLSSLLSALLSSCCYKPLLVRKSLFSFVIRWKSSSSSSSFFVFFNDHSFVIFFLKFYLSNLIWEIHFEGRVLINKTPSNTDLLPKTTKYQHWFDFFFFQILHALFLLKIYLFSCRVLKKICGYMLCNFIYLFCGCSTFLSYAISEKKSEFGILVPTPPFSVQDFKSLWIEIWFFKFSMIWVFKKYKEWERKKNFQKKYKYFLSQKNRRIFLVEFSLIMTELVQVVHNGFILISHSIMLFCCFLTENVFQNMTY